MIIGFVIFALFVTMIIRPSVIFRLLDKFALYIEKDRQR